MSALTGSCLCGQCRFALDRTPKVVVHCHCSICRRAHAAAFATYAQLPFKYFHWDSEAAPVRVYESTPGVLRYFCERCGSHLMHCKKDSPKFAAVSFAVLADATGISPMAHLYAGSKVSWVHIHDELPQHDTLP